MTKPGQTSAATINVSGPDLDAAATKIVDAIGLPSFRQAMAEESELRGLEPLRVVDLLSASLAESLFAGAADDQDVLIDLDKEFVTVPPGQRELLQSAITRALSARTAELAKLLEAKS